MIFKGLKIWLDEDVMRLNTDDRGKFVGEFKGKDRIVSFYGDGSYSTYKPDVATHFEEDMRLIEKFNEKRVYSVVYFDKDQKYHYIKRFVADNAEKLLPYLPEDGENDLTLITTEDYPRIKIEFGGKNKDRADEEVDVEEFIAVKGYKAKGKRLSNYTIKKVTELEPVKQANEENIPDSEVNAISENNESEDFKPDGDYNGEQMSLNLD